MADVATSVQGSDGVAFLVSAGIVYEIIAAACSSPQTAEINAASRAGTLMKWVHVGVAQGLVFIAVAAVIDRQHRVAIVAGGGLAAGLMYGQYAHAIRAGLASDEPPTERNAPPGLARVLGVNR